MGEITVSYDREKIIQVIKDLNLLVVSLDRIGSAWHDRNSDEQYNAMFVSFTYEFDLFKKLATARQILEEPFPYEAGEDGMDELERLMQDLQYWSETNNAQWT